MHFKKAVLAFGTAMALLAASCGEFGTQSKTTLRFSIEARFADGEPVRPQRMDYTVTLLSGPPVSRSLFVEDAAHVVSFEFEDPNGRIRIDASMPADLANCTAYCAAQTGTATDSCKTDCVRGSRKLLATTTLDYTAPPGQPEPRVADLSTDLVFTDLSQPTDAIGGFDLQVDGEAAAASVKITNESFDSSSCAVQEGCILGTGERRLLRFAGVLMNLGDEDFLLGSPIGNPAFEYSSCSSHQHFHFREAIKYELIERETGKAVVTKMGSVVGRKQGFCLIDIRRILGREPGKYSCSFQGITAGWADVYHSGLDCQWLDITDVKPGKYILKLTVNPTGGIRDERNQSNNSSETLVEIPSI